MMAESVEKGQFVSWTTDKGRYVGQVSSVKTSGEIAVVSSSGGQETFEASMENPVANVRVYVDNQDGSYSRSDRTAPVKVSMLRVIKEPELKQVSEKVRQTLSQKAKDHNDDVGDAKTKKTTTRTLVVVFERGVGAYQTNPQSVRPTVSSAEQWAYARVNSFLYALRNGRFRGGKHDTDLLPKGHPQSTKSLEKGPACRQRSETKKECVERKISELIELDGMEPNQAVAVANSLCDQYCDEKECGEKSSHVTNFPKRGDDKKVSLRNSEFNNFPLDYAENLRTNYPEIWRKGGNILGNTQYRRLKKVHRQMGEVKTPTDEKAVRLREAWAARHFKDYRLAGVIAQVKWLVIGSRGLSHMKRVINEAKKEFDDAQEK